MWKILPIWRAIVTMTVDETNDDRPSLARAVCFT